MRVPGFDINYNFLTRGNIDIFFMCYKVLESWILAITGISQVSFNYHPVLSFKKKKIIKLNNFLDFVRKSMYITFPTHLRYLCSCPVPTCRPSPPEISHWLIPKSSNSKCSTNRWNLSSRRKYVNRILLVKRLDAISKHLVN